jgi:hypothetical protein
MVEAESLDIKDIKKVTKHSKGWEIEMTERTDKNRNRSKHRRGEKYKQDRA